MATTEKTKKQPKAANKMSDIISYTRAGAPVLFVYDRDISFFIERLLEAEDTISRKNLDDFDVYVFFQGFFMIYIKKVQEKGGGYRTNVQIVEFKDPMGQNQPVSDSHVAADLFLGKTREKITDNKNAVLVMVMDPQHVNNNIHLCATLREHYNMLVTEKLQCHVVPKAASGSGRSTATPSADRVDDYVPGEGAKRTIRTIIILGSNPMIPQALSGFTINVGSINRKISSPRDILPKKLTSSLTTSEITVMEELALLDGKKDALTNDIKIAMAKRTRKSIFTSNSILDDLDYTGTIEEIGGYKMIKDFAEQRKVLLTENMDKLTAANVKLKGLFIAGVPGSGKTRLLSALGNEWGLPSYKLRLEAAFGRYVGDSESNLIAALDALEKLAPCYCLMDEVDKALAGVGEGEVAGSDVPKRVFGILLDYMARDNDVLFAACANRVKGIPEEFMRRGRFDRIFFMDLPNEMSRLRIIGIHLQKHNMKLEDFEKDGIKRLVNSTEGFTGAEIEAVITESTIRAITEDKKVTIDILVEEATKTTTMNTKKKDITDLKDWATNYAITAN